MLELQELQILLSDYKLTQVVHRIIVKTDGIQLEMLHLEISISQTLSDSFSVKQLQSSCDCQIAEVLLAHHQVLKGERISAKVALTDSQEAFILVVSIKEVVSCGIGAFCLAPISISMGDSQLFNTLRSQRFEECLHI